MILFSKRFVGLLYVKGYNNMLVKLSSKFMNAPKQYVLAHWSEFFYTTHHNEISTTC
jgi:hypothetical protein